MATSQTEIFISQQPSIPVPENCSIVKIRGPSEAVQFAELCIHNKSRECDRLAALNMPKHMGNVNFESSVVNSTQPWKSTNQSASGHSFKKNPSAQDPCVPNSIPPGLHEFSSQLNPNASLGSGVSFAEGEEPSTSSYCFKRRCFEPSVKGDRYMGNFTCAFVETAFVYMSICSHHQFNTAIQYIRRMPSAFVKIRQVISPATELTPSWNLNEVMIQGNAFVQWTGQSYLYELNPAVIFIELDIPSIFMARIIGQHGRNLRDYANSTTAIFSTPPDSERIRSPKMDRRTKAQLSVLQIYGDLTSVQKAQRLVRGFLQSLYGAHKYKDAKSNDKEDSPVTKDNISNVDDCADFPGISASVHDRGSSSSHGKDKDSSKDPDNYKGSDKDKDSAGDHTNVKDSTEDPDTGRDSDEDLNKISAEGTHKGKSSIEKYNKGSDFVNHEKDKGSAYDVRVADLSAADHAVAIIPAVDNAISSDCDSVTDDQDVWEGFRRDFEKLRQNI